MGKVAPDEPHALYRFFGAGGTLLYIGITNSIPTRLKAHNRDKPWWLGVTNITIEHYPDRLAVLEAERRAIIAEKPLYNEVHNGAARWLNAEVVEVSSDALMPICMGCGNSISEDWETGLLHVRHSDISRVASEWGDWNSSGRVLADIPEVVRWQVHCLACNPHWVSGEGPCGGCYSIHTERCRSWRDLLWWSSHLSDKAWLASTDWFDLMRAVAEGREGAPFVADSEFEAVA